jgi:hypothetical protein
MTVACREALKVYTPEQTPQDWALMQASLGLALAKQATRSAEPEASRLLREAVGAFQAALRVYTPSEFPNENREVTRNLRLAENALVRASKPL